MVILDTDLMSLLGWSDSAACKRLQARLATIPAKESATTVVTFEEFTRGWLAVLARGKRLSEQVQAYRRLNRQLSLFCAVRLLDFEERAALEFQRLRKEKPRLGTMDLKIAAIALMHGATLLSRNLRDFEQIPGLSVEDWTQ